MDAIWTDDDAPGGPATDGPRASALAPRAEPADELCPGKRVHVIVTGVSRLGVCAKVIGGSDEDWRQGMVPHREVFVQDYEVGQTREAVVTRVREDGRVGERARVPPCCRQRRWDSC